MSTTIDLRVSGDLPRRAARPVAPVGRPTEDAPQPPATGRARPARARAAQPKVAGRARPAVARPRLSWRPGGAGLVGLVTVVLSILGLIYLTQISHVARYGYLLSDLEDQRAKIDRENKLLEYRISNERTLARASDIAGHDYQMQSFSDAPKVGTQVAGAPKAVATAASRTAPQIRFVAAQRPAARPADPAAAPRPTTLIDRLWNGIVGIGTARAAAR